VLTDGRKVTVELFRELLADELPKIETYVGPDAWRAGKYTEAARLFETMCTGDYVEFLTLPAYDRLTDGIAEDRIARAA
jgi:malate synthase